MKKQIVSIRKMEERTLKHQPHNVMLQVYQEDGDILMNEIVINSNGGKQ